jgi:filamentous hemagglutinin family protein
MFGLIQQQSLSIPYSKSIFTSLVFFALSLSDLYTAPAGFECVQGNAKLAQQSNGITRIESSGRAIIHWNEFSIAIDEIVRFDQLGVDKSVLNRVTGESTSHLLGSLLSNGNVFLINPNGVFIGPGARIETNGFLASTADVLDKDFLNGNEMLFFQKNNEGKIINQGTIECPIGSVFLFATYIDNQGTIRAPQGDITLVASPEILLSVQGKERVFIRSKEAISQITEDLKTQGSPFACAIRSTGQIDAGVAVENNGRIFLLADKGKVEIDGKITAPSILATGEEVHVLENAIVDASNLTGGGEILIGGDLKGANPEVPNAKRTFVQEGACISANAIDEGIGGKIVIWSDDHTVYRGHVEAKGPDQGGFVEISGGKLGFNGTSDLRSASGKTGTLLLDPQFITIDPGGGVFVGPTDPFANNVGGTDSFTGASLAGVINTSAVVLQANTDVTFNDTVTTAGAVGSLTVQAGRSIAFTGAGIVTLTGTAFFNGTINDVAAIGADRLAGNAGFTMAPGASLTSTNGNITVNFGSFGGTAEGYLLIDGATISSTAGIISLSGQGYGGANIAPDNTGITVQGASLISSGGAVTLTGTGGDVNAALANGISLAGTSNLQVTGAGDLNISGTVGAGATFGTSDGVIGTSAVIIESTAGASGDIIITGISNSTDAAGSNNGVNLTSTVRSLGTGTITITGTGSPNSTGPANEGILFQSSARVSSVFGDIMINGFRGGTGAAAGCSAVQLTGNVLITGTGPAGVNIQATGGSNPTGGQSTGFTLASLGLQCLISTVDGDITINGTGSSAGVGVISNYGVFFLNGSLAGNGGALTTGAGDINITGLALSGNTSAGIEFENSSFRALGTGDININGVSMTMGAGVTNSGVHIANTAPQTNVIRAANGNITIIGDAGGGPGSQQNDGIYISGGAIAGNLYAIETLGAGTITMTGRSLGTSVNSANNGVFLDLRSTVRSTSALANAGSITITGTGIGGSSPNSNGVVLGDTTMVSGIGGRVESVNGPIQVTGFGNSNQNDNRGVFVSFAGDIISTGTATINVQGTGGFGALNNNGIQVDGTGSSITSSGTGVVTLIGQGGPGTVLPANQNQGIRVSNSGLITTVTGNVTATGTGGGNSLGTNNIGIDVDSGGDITTTGSASLILRGTGGNGTTNNSGIQVDGAGSTISSTSNGALSLIGNGSAQAAATSQNQGIRLLNSGLITTLNGTVTATGTGGGNGAGTNNVGIDIEATGQITSTGTGSITATGTGGAGTATNYGVQISGLNAQIASSSTGPISVIGNHGAATLEDIVVELQGSVVSSTSAPIALTANLSDILIQDAGSITSSGTGTVTANAVNDIRLEGGTGLNQFAEINLTNGDAFITAQGDVILTGGSGTGAYAQIGSNTVAGTPATANITVTAQGNVVVDGTDLDSYAIIGHGNPQQAVPLNLSGNITVRAVDVLVDGADVGPGAQGFGQIGHTNALAVATTLSGDIFVDVTNDIVLTGGTAATTGYARIGHGGITAGVAPTVTGNILLIADVDIILTSNPTGQAQIQNLGPGTVVCVVDDLFPTSCFFGPGQFILSADSLIETTGGQLRLYTVMPSQNTVNELINGAAFIPGPFNVNSATETWSTYYPDGGYGGPDFNFYYKIPCIIPTDEILTPITELAIDNSQLVPLLPFYLPFNYEDYPYHPKVCIEDWIEPRYRIWRIRQKQYKNRFEDIDCEPTFNRFNSMIFENYLK